MDRRAALVVALVVALASLTSCRVTGSRAPESMKQSTKQSTRKSTKKSTKKPTKKSTKKSTTPTSESAAPDPPTGCARCELDDGECGEWWEDGDSHSGETVAGFLPCDPRCCAAPRP